MKKHGVEPIHLWNSDWYYDKSISRFALKFSRLNKIVESNVWANKMPENGIDGYNTEIAKNIQKKRIENGTHHLVGTVSVINKQSKTKIIPMEEYKNQSEFVTITSNKGYEYRGLDPKIHRKTNAGKTYDVKEDSKIFLKGDNRTEKQKEASKNHSEIVKKLGIHPTKKGEKLTEKHRQNLRGPRPNARKPKEIVTCPCCGKQGGISQMKRWHFDNCPNKSGGY